MKIAQVGNIIEFKGGVRGIVEKVNENSVIVSIIAETLYYDFEYDRTVVNHKNYKIISKGIQAVS